MENNGADRLRELERQHHRCNHDVSMHMAASEQKWISQAQTNLRLEQCSERIKRNVEQIDMKVTAIEKKVAWVAGMAALAGAIIPYLVNLLIKHI